MKPYTKRYSDVLNELVEELRKRGYRGSLKAGGPVMSILEEAAKRIYAAEVAFAVMAKNYMPS